MSNAVIAFQVPRATYVGHLYYELWRSTTQLANTLAATVEAGATKLRDVDAGVAINGGLTPGTTYWYYLASVRADGERGPFSEYEFAATTLNAANITDNAVTLAKIEQIATAHLLGRNTAGTGNVEVLDAATVRTLLGLGALALKASIATADIDDNAVTFAKVQDVATARLLGRNTAGAGAVEELTAATVRTILNVADGADVSPVSSVAGRTGAVTLSTSDVSGLGTAAQKNTGASGDAVPLLNQPVDFSNAEVSLSGIPTYADDAAAGAGGLAANRTYKTATGEFRIKT